MGAWALVVSAAGLWLPGVAVLRALRPSADALVLAAGAPVLSVAVLWSWAEVVSLSGVPVSWVSVLLPVLVLAVALVVLVEVGRRRAGAATDETAAPVLGRAQWVTLALVASATLVAWWTATDGLALVPPGTDGQHHGLMAQRILELGTLDQSRVFVPDVLVGTGDAYYPLALHTVSALVSSLTGAPVATTLNAVLVLACAVVLPLGCAVLTRRLFPLHPWAPPVAALAAVAFPAYPYFLGHWGMYPLLVATAFVAPVLELLLGSVDDMRAVAGGAVLGLSAVSLFSVHASELLLVVLLGGLLVIGDVVRRGRGHLRAAALRVAWAVPLLLLAVLPSLGALSAAPERLATADVIPTQPIGQALVLSRAFVLGPWFYLATDEYVGTPSDVHVTAALLGVVVVLALLVVGCVTTLRRRQRPEWLVGWALVVVLGVWAAARLPGVEAATWPWFSQWYRIGSAETLFLSTYLGVGAAVAADRLLRHRGRALVGLAAVLLALLPLLPQLVLTRAVLGYDFRVMSLADPSARAAWEYIRERARPGERVLNEHADGSGWMYPVAGLAPLFAIKREYYPPDDRQYLADHVGDLLTDARAARAAQDWRVRWAYVGPRTFSGQKVELDASALAASPAWRLVFDQDGARVYERVTG